MRRDSTQLPSRALRCGHEHAEETVAPARPTDHTSTYRFEAMLGGDSRSIGVAGDQGLRPDDVLQLI